MYLLGRIKKPKFCGCEEKRSDIYNTGIFAEFCLWEWDFSRGKCNLEKIWAGKWDRYPLIPSGPSIKEQGWLRIDNIYMDYKRQP